VEKGRGERGERERGTGRVVLPAAVLRHVHIIRNKSVTAHLTIVMLIFVLKSVPEQHYRAISMGRKSFLLKKTTQNRLTKHKKKGA
jgi:hypothetical protein